MGALILAGAGLMAAGKIQEGREVAAAEKSAQNIQNFNAAIMEQEAKAIRAKGAFEKVRQVKEAERIKSRLRTKIAGMGALESGLLEEEQAAELELENLLIGYETETAARRAESQAVLDRAAGKLAKRRGRAAKQAGYIGAGATLLTGFGMAGMGGGNGSTKFKWSSPH